jgi:RimJ/RimL family protein N-acetyltransferase
MVGPNISGEKVSLRPLRNDDLAHRVEWLDDSETMFLFTGIRPGRGYKMSDAERWRKSVEADPLAKVWAVETKDGFHIGDVDLHDIDRSNHSARLTILIGDEGSRNQGYGTDAVRTILRHAFTSLGLASVSLRVCDFNARAVRCYEKCGFVRYTPDTTPPGWHPGDIFMVATRERFGAQYSDAGIV